MESVLVSISAPAFSYLLYENARSEYDQEGFLLGKVHETETKSITDNEQEMVKLERIISVNCAIPCPHVGYFYNGIGQIDIEKLKSFLGDRSSDVVAWFKFRRSTGFKLTLREKVIHKVLAKVFQTPLDLFTTCLLTQEVSQNASTHLFSQTFIRYKNATYQPLPIHIVNLSDPNNSYRKPHPISKQFKELLTTIKIDLKNTQGPKAIGEIHNILQKEIQNMSGELASESEQLFQLEEEIKQLKHALKLKTEKKEKVIENSSVDNAGGDAMLEVVSEKEWKSNNVCNQISYAQATQGRK